MKNILAFPMPSDALVWNNNLINASVHEDQEG